MICPAFQSAFIYNDSTRERLFAYFTHDSLPAIEPYATKNKYGIIEKVSKNKRYNQLQTVEMRRIYPPKDTYRDSLLLVLSDAPTGETMNIDSLMGARSQLRNRYNVEQETYMQLFGQYLNLPEPPDPDEDLETTATSEEAEPTENMTRKEKRQARRAAKAKAREERSQQNENDGSQEEDEDIEDF